MLKNNNSEIFEILETGISRVTSFIQHSNLLEICEKATLKKIRNFKLSFFCITLKNDKFKIFSRNFNEYKDLFQYLKVLTRTLTKSKKNSTLTNFWILSYRYRSPLLLFPNVKMDWNCRGNTIF